MRDRVSFPELDGGAIAYREGWFGLKRDPGKADYWLSQLEVVP